MNVGEKGFFSKVRRNTKKCTISDRVIIKGRLVYCQSESDLEFTDYEFALNLPNNQFTQIPKVFCASMAFKIGCVRFEQGCLKFDIGRSADNPFTCGDRKEKDAEHQPLTLCRVQSNRIYVVGDLVHATREQSGGEAIGDFLRIVSFTKHRELNYGEVVLVLTNLHTLLARFLLGGGEHEFHG